MYRSHDTHTHTSMHTYLTAIKLIKCPFSKKKLTTENCKTTPQLQLYLWVHSAVGTWGPLPSFYNTTKIYVTKIIIHNKDKYIILYTSFGFFL